MQSSTLKDSAKLFIDYKVAFSIKFKLFQIYRKQLL